MNDVDNLALRCRAVGAVLTPLMAADKRSIRKYINIFLELSPDMTDWYRNQDVDDVMVTGLH